MNSVLAVSLSNALGTISRVPHLASLAVHAFSLNFVVSTVLEFIDRLVALRSVHSDLALSWEVARSAVSLKVALLEA